MSNLFYTFIFLLVSFSASASDFSYQEAEKNWQVYKNTSDYKHYATAFEEYSKRHQLDTRMGCYDLGSEQVILYLVIEQGKRNKYAVVTDVLSNFNTKKSRCFVDGYNDMQMSVPPYFPFVLRMEFK